MEGESIYIVYVLLIYFIVVFVYGVVTFFSYKQTCSNLKNTGSPGQVCASPDSRTARCWNSGNSGSQLSCSHCVFGYKTTAGGHVCKSKDDIVQENNNMVTCKYDGVTDLELVTTTPSDSAVTIEYKTADDRYVVPDSANTPSILTLLQQNCYYDLKIKSAVAVKTECNNVTTNGDGICRKDYDTYVKEQQIRYRPEGEGLPSLQFTNEVTTTSTSPELP